MTTKLPTFSLECHFKNVLLNVVIYCNLFLSIVNEHQQLQKEFENGKLIQLENQNLFNPIFKITQQIFTSAAINLQSPVYSQQDLLLIDQLFIENQKRSMVTISHNNQIKH